MEPRIQYTQTEDGVSIAYSLLGRGPALVHTPWFPLSNLQLEWQIPEFRDWYERLAEKRTLVRYDGRGTGLSDRQPTEFSVEARVPDLEAVVDGLRLERFTLLGPLHTGPVAITYAERHPERVTRLILWCSYAKGSDFGQSPQVQATRAVAGKDWQTFTELAAHALATGWEAGDLARRLATVMRESVTQQGMLAFIAQADQFDVTDLLPRVTVPTLVIHRRQLSTISIDVAKALAAQIPEGRLALLEGTALVPFVGDMDVAAEAIDEFLAEGEEPTAAAEQLNTQGAVHTILFTDVEGSTALTQRLGDTKARDLLREHDRVTREALKAHGGSEVKTMGDGFMTSFGSATKALECAIAIQRAFAQHNDSADEPIKVRIGLNAGEPISEAEDLFGTAVNMAARICAKADGGQILAPIVVRELVAGKGFLLSDVGETELRGFEDPVRLFEVRWRE